MTRGALGSCWLALLGAASCSPAAEARAPEHAGSSAAGTETAPYFCVVTSAEACFNARDDNCNGIIDEGCGLPVSKLEFVIAWEKPAADVDLIVRDARQALVEAGQVSEAGLTKDRDCPGKNQECLGRNRESVYLGEGAEVVRGTYQVTVRLEGLHGEEAPIAVELGVRLDRRLERRALRFERDDEQRTFEFAL